MGPKTTTACRRPEKKDDDARDDVEERGKTRRLFPRGRRRRRRRALRGLLLLRIRHHHRICISRETLRLLLLKRARFVLYREGRNPLFFFSALVPAKKELWRLLFAPDFIYACAFLKIYIERKLDLYLNRPSLFLSCVVTKLGRAFGKDDERRRRRRFRGLYDDVRFAAFAFASSFARASATRTRRGRRLCSSPN